MFANSLFLNFVNVKEKIMRGFWCCLTILSSMFFVCSLNAQEVADTLNLNLKERQKELRRNGLKPQTPVKHVLLQDTVQLTDTLMMSVDSVEAKKHFAELKHMQDSILSDSIKRLDYGKVRMFKPDPNRAMWLSLLCPGLGQIYNRRYWKLPLVVGGFVGLGYATAWNNKMYVDYTKAYRDAMDNDPSTKSYMDFYPPTTKEEDLDMAWLKKALKSKKDYYRRNKELCIISMVGMYLLCVVDAYVDASLMNFDISEDLSMQVKPAVINPQYTDKKLPSLGLQCAFNF